MQAANERLEQERAEGKLAQRDIENLGQTGGEGGYIEMNLGLGVLEEKKGGREDMAAEGEEGEEDEGGESTQGEGDVLGRLMGKRRERERPGIEVL